LFAPHVWPMGRATPLAEPGIIHRGADALFFVVGRVTDPAKQTFVGTLKLRKTMRDRQASPCRPDSGSHSAQAVPPAPDLTTTFGPGAVSDVNWQVLLNNLSVVLFHFANDQLLQFGIEARCRK